MARVIGILAFVAVLALLQCRGTAADDNDSFFLVQNPITNMLVSIIKFVDEQTKVAKCQIISDPAVVEMVKKITGDDKIAHPSVAQMEKARKKCEASLTGMTWDEEARDAEDEEESRKWSIVPGTKWCGDGDEAENYDDLGYFEDTDRCCRAHDQCDDIIPAGETKFNLTNDSYFTKLSCKCDYEFYDCLKATDKAISFTVGFGYFTALGRECYEQRYPFSDTCKSSLLGLTCLEYEVDTNKPKVYQFVSTPSYYK